MKMIKRSFGILLVAILLLNLFGATVSAAVMPDRLLSIRVRAIESNVEAGDTVRLVTNFESGEEFPYWAAGTIEIGYNDEFFTVSEVFTETYYDIGYPYENTIDAPNSHVQYMGLYPTDKEVTNFKWNACIQLGMAADNFDDWVDASVDGGVDVFEFRIKVNDDTPDGVYYLGFSEAGFHPEAMASYINEKEFNMAYNGFDVGLDYGLSAPDTPLYDLSEAVVAITVGSPATDPVVTNDGVKVQWDNDDSHVKLGYKATISDLELTTTYNAEADAYEVNELSEVGVIFSTTIENPTLADVGNGATKATCNTLYDNKDGTYSFRAVVKGAPIDNTTTINSVMYITLADGTTSYYSISGTTTPKAAFDAGRANGMPDFGV